jgi:hypothetical protein
MRAKRMHAIAVIPLVAGVLAGCGDSKEPQVAPSGKTVSGETETGMKLKVDTFVDPAKDPKVKELDAWRATAGYPKVDFHRVTADNAATDATDSGRPLRFSSSAAALTGGGGIEARFSCDALTYEWIPVKDDQNARWNALRKEICADGPPKQDGIAPGQRKVYYLVTDRTFAERGIRNLKVFGPRDVEFR